MPSIAIVGGGIGGLATALSLIAAGFDDLQVLEAADELRPLGVGINLPPHAVRELTELGLGDRLKKIAVETSTLSYYDRRGNLIWAEPRGLRAGYSWPQYSVHRGLLQKTLAEAFQERSNSASLKTGRVFVEFADTPLSGGRIRFVTRGHSGLEYVESDALIGADGIRSAVRQQLFPGKSQLPWNGWVMYRGVSSIAPFLDGRTMVIVGDEEQRVVAYPIAEVERTSGRQDVNWILTRRIKESENDSIERGNWNRPIAPLGLVPHVEGWSYPWLDIAKMIGAADSAVVYPMVDLEPLERWSQENITLLGDAAHAMYPFGSNGASQAILDARYLAREVASYPTWAAAFSAYEAIRRPVTREVQLANRRQAADVMSRVGALARQHAHERAATELQEAETSYKKLAGFDAKTLNERASLSVSRHLRPGLQET